MNVFSKFPVLVMGAFLVAVASNLTAAEPKAAKATTREAKPAEYAKALLAETNRVRRENNCRALQGASRLDRAADDHASYMSMRMEAVHESSLPGQATPMDRVQRRGMEPLLCQENVGIVSAGDGEEISSPAEIAKRIVAMWMNSPAHRENILSRDMTHVGGGIRLGRDLRGKWQAFAVQVFVKMPQVRGAR